MYQSIQAKDNARAIGLINEREDILECIAQLQIALKDNEQELFEAINAYRPQEVIRNVSNGKEYMVERRRILNCLNQEVCISYTIHSMTKEWVPSKNASLDQMNVSERTGKTI